MGGHVARVLPLSPVKPKLLSWRGITNTIASAAKHFGVGLIFCRIKALERFAKNGRSAFATPFETVDPSAVVRCKTLLREFEC
jgi:hypothetical protein